MNLSRHQILMLVTAGLLIFLTFVDVDSLKIPFLANPKADDDDDEEDEEEDEESDKDDEYIETEGNEVS